ncbi:UDP-N-acetylglucosamine diphosphorylase [Verrucomicrobia bacterium LW23]|nr:UDP-N-acetylglucosamine diphosphorylase [Verrucomicrobia bacterium LW23]
MFSPGAYLDLQQTAHASLFDGIEHVWEVLPRIGGYLRDNLRPANHGRVLGQPYIGENVFIGEGTEIDPGVVIKGPAWIGANCQLRPGAYIRDNVIIGDGCVIGNSCEFKNCILFNGCQVPHFSYVGDSVMGYKAHLGAGVILSNFKLDGTNISIPHDGKIFHTGLRKFGAILGDRAEVGCNAVLNPGSIIGRRSIIYSGAQWRGVLPESSVAKTVLRTQVVERRSGT